MKPLIRSRELPNEKFGRDHAGSLIHYAQMFSLNAAWLTSHGNAKTISISLITQEK